MTAQTSSGTVWAPLLIYMVAGSYWCPSLLAGGLRVDPRAQEPGFAVTMTDAFKNNNAVLPPWPGEQPKTSAVKEWSSTGLCTNVSCTCRLLRCLMFTVCLRATLAPSRCRARVARRARRHRPWQRSRCPGPECPEASALTAQGHVAWKEALASRAACSHTTGSPVHWAPR